MVGFLLPSMDNHHYCIVKIISNSAFLPFPLSKMVLIPNYPIERILVQQVHLQQTSGDLIFF